MYFQVNLGSAQTFNQIEMNAGGSTGDYARGYNVEVSSNGTSFTSVATGTGTSSPQTVTFTAQTAQYIRVVLTAASTTNWWSIAEFTAYTSGSGTSPAADRRQLRAQRVRVHAGHVPELDPEHAEHDRQ